MRKLYLPFLLLLLLPAFTNAQSGNKISLSFGPELDLPLNTTNQYYGSVGDYYQDGIGINLKAELPLIPFLHIIGSAGYVWYPSNLHRVYIVPSVYPGGQPASTDQRLPPYKFMPVSVGLRYYFVKYVYIDAETGGAIKVNSVSSNSLTYSATFGFVIPFNNHSGLDPGIKYERGFETVDYPSPMSQIGISLAYKFGF